jgi:hypothetical protein
MTTPLLEITLDPKDLAELKSKLSRKLWEPAIGLAISRLALGVERKAKEGAPKDTRALMRDIRADIRPLEAKVHPPRQLEYFKVQEFGRRPGRRMPPPSALLGWLRRKGIDPRAAFVIARSIGRRGLKGRFYMRAAREWGQNAMPRELRVAASEIEKRFGKNGPI